MEFEAISNGKTVRASYQDLSQGGAEEGERVFGIGSTPYEVVYQNDEKRTRRTVDLRELASASGLEKVDFKFDRDKAIELGLMSKEAKVDQGDVYNLERIKSEEGRMQYLTDKGHQGIVKNGDSYYGTKDGSIVPINYTTGLGIDDVTRMVGSAGQMVGAGVAIGAAGGASIVTGGAALAGVAGAGAAGGAVGEGVQRVTDKVFGADAAKYNAELGASEEAMAFGKAGAMGAVDALGGQLITRGLAAGKNVIAKGLEAGGEMLGVANPMKQWAEGKAAKLQMSALEQRLPTGVFGGSMSEEQAAAQTLMNAGKQKGVSTATTKEAAGTAKDLMDGSLRKGAVASEEDMAQQAALRSQADEIASRAGKEQSESVASEMAKKLGRTQDQVLVEEQMKDTSREVFGARFGKELDEVFKEGGSKEAADAARNKIEAGVIADFTSNTNVKVIRDPITGTVTGIDQDAMTAYLSQNADSTMKNAADFIKSFKASMKPGDTVPSSAVKQETISTLNGISGSLKGAAYTEMKSEVSNVVAAVKGHTRDAASQARLRDAIGVLEDRVRSQYGSAGMMEEAGMALRSIEEATSRYQINATSNVEGLQQALNIQTEYMGMRKMSSDGIADRLGDTTAKYMEGLQTLERLTGDPAASQTRQAIAAIDVESTLRGQSSVVRKLLEPGQRANMDAFQFVRHNTIPKGTGAAARGKESAAGRLVNNPASEEIMELIAGIAPGGRSILAAGRLIRASGGAASDGIDKAKSVVAAAKQGAKSMAQGAANFAAKSTVQAPLLRAATGAEESMTYAPKKKEEAKQGRLVSR